MGTVREERAFWVHQIHSTLLNSIAAAILQSRVCEQAARVGASDCADEIQRLQGILAGLETAARAIAARTVEHLSNVTAEARRLIQEFRATHPAVELKAHVSGSDSRVPWRVADATRVVLQEALVNISRHAGARSVEVRLAVEQGSVLLRVRDDGCGFDVSRQLADRRSEFGTNWGLRLMREYAEMAGGRLEVSSASARGSQVTLFIPVREPASLPKNPL